MLQISQAQSNGDLRHARELIAEYMDSVGGHHFGDREQELDGLPGLYAPPEGRLLLAHFDDSVAGCVGIRKVEDGICEMKRMYVRPEFRGKGLGRELARMALDEARSIGYKTMRLQTLEWMTGARALYRSVGFQENGCRVGEMGEPIVLMKLDLH